MSEKRSLWDAVLSANIALAEELCADNNVDVNEMKNQWTPLMYCCWYARDAPDSPGHKYLKIIDLILKHPQRNLNKKDKTGYTELHHLCNVADPPSVTAAEMLLSQEDVLVNEQNKYDKTPLMYCAAKARDKHGEDGTFIVDEYVRIMKLIMKHPKYDSNVVDKDGFTSLHWICESQGSVLAARALLRQPDTCYSALTHKGSTPLHVLMHAEGFDMKQKILIFNEFMKHPDFKDCVFLLDNAGMSVTDRFLFTGAYDIGLAHSGKKLLELLLNIDGLVNVSGMTLALCATLASPAAFQMLLDSGANISDSLPGGETTAHCVIQKNSLQKFRILFQHHPDMSRIWNYSTPQQLALSHDCKAEILHGLGVIKSVNNEDESGQTRGVLIANSSHTSACPFTTMLDVYKPYISTTIRLDSMNKENLLSEKHSPQIYFFVKHNQSLLRNRSNEVKEIRHAVDGIFVQFATKLKEFKTSSHFAFVHFLCGSSGDNTKCYEPDEMDFVCVFSSDIQFQYDHSKQQYTIHPGCDSGWAAHCNSDGKLDVRAASQAFYLAFAQFCHKYEPSTDEEDIGICSISFQFMSQISRIKCIWNGRFFKNMAVFADVVPAFVAHVYIPTNPLPLGATCEKYFAIGKASRYNNLPRINFPISHCKAEYHMMTSLSAPLRQGFITAKSVRLAAICATGLDLKALFVVEDLNIENYVTSYSLKTCLLILLQHVCVDKTYCTTTASDAIKDQMIKTVINTHCKYQIADTIYWVFQAALESDKKQLRVWYDTNKNYPATLYDCEDCSVAISREQSVDDEVEKVCCRKRRVRLALIKQIRSWLTNAENLRALHGGDECTCVYSPEEMDEHGMIMARLLKTGKLAHAEDRALPCCHMSVKTSFNTNKSDARSLKSKASKELDTQIDVLLSCI